jgi:hypothetical protein
MVQPISQQIFQSKLLRGVLETIAAVRDHILSHFSLIFNAILLRICLFLSYQFFFDQCQARLIQIPLWEHFHLLDGKSHYVS